MALPNGYNLKDYLEEALAFLEGHAWIFNFPNTHVLSNRVFDRMPPEWFEYFQTINCDELHCLASGRSTSNTPTPLKDFLEKLLKLSPNLPLDDRKINYTLLHNAKLGSKKIHEILALGPLIDDISKRTKCDFILDVGTGLGYLPRLLSDVYGYKVLGVECDAKKIATAKLTPRDSVEYYEHYISENSESELESLLQTLEAQNVCITGLHACADLSVTILEIFSNLTKAKSLVIMPCCYHRLKQCEAGFANFPTSKILKDHASDIFTVPFLRLACQSFNFIEMTEDEHEVHSRGCLYRAILQEVADEKQIQVRRIKRKSGKSCRSFEDYLKELERTHALIDADIKDHKFLERMREKWNFYKDRHIGPVTGLMALQYALQEVCENLVLLDRVAMMNEKGMECYVTKVTDRKISPRCHALIAVKP